MQPQITPAITTPALNQTPISMPQTQAPSLDLSGLKDIHTPQELDSLWWPLAYGWWILLIALILIPLIIYFIKYYRIHSAKVYALKKMATLTKIGQENAVLYTEEISKLLRRIAVLKYPKEQVASLSGQAWLDFLNKNGHLTLSNKTAQLFAYAPYAKGQKLSSDEIDEIQKAATNWIKKNA